MSVVTIPACTCTGQPSILPVGMHGGFPWRMCLSMMHMLVQVGMLFVRCRDGVSHSPLEHVDGPDVALATASLYSYLLESLQHHTKDEL